MKTASVAGLILACVGVAASVTAHTELKFEFLDSFKNRPLPGLKKNDTSLITAFVWKL